MDAVKKVLMQQLIKIVAPTSPAYGNGSNLPFIKQQSMPDLIKQLQIGDIIFTKTNNSVYQMCRSFLQTDYDHVSVVINKNQVIHISPPIISKLQIYKIVQKSREPLIFRPNFQSNCDEISAKERKDIFLIILHHYLGQKYNELAIPTMFKNQFASRFEKLMIQMLSLNQNSRKEKYKFNKQMLKYSKICSQAVLYALYKSHPSLCENMQAYVNTQTNYKYKGFIMPDQLKQYLQAKKLQIIYNGHVNRQAKSEVTMLDRIAMSQQFVVGKAEPIVDLLKSSAEKVSSLIFSALTKTKDSPIDSHSLLMGSLNKSQQNLIGSVLKQVLNHKNLIGKGFLTSKLYFVFVILSMIVDMTSFDSAQKVKYQKVLKILTLIMDLLFLQNLKNAFLQRVKAKL